MLCAGKLHHLPIRACISSIDCIKVHLRLLTVLDLCTDYQRTTPWRVSIIFTMRQIAYRCTRLPNYGCNFLRHTESPHRGRSLPSNAARSRINRSPTGPPFRSNMAVLIPLSHFVARNAVRCIAIPHLSETILVITLSVILSSSFTRSSVCSILRLLTLAFALRRL